MIPSSQKLNKRIKQSIRICFLTEVLLRYYDIINKDKIWFLSNVEHSLNIVQIQIKNNI